MNEVRELLNVEQLGALCCRSGWLFCITGCCGSGGRAGFLLNATVLSPDAPHVEVSTGKTLTLRMAGQHLILQLSHQWCVCEWVWVGGWCNNNIKHIKRYSSTVHLFWLHYNIIQINKGKYFMNDFTPILFQCFIVLKLYCVKKESLKSLCLSSVHTLLALCSSPESTQDGRL